MSLYTIPLEVLDAGCAPTRGRPGDVGYDTFARLDAPVVVQPGETVTIPLGFKMAMPWDLFATLRPRSGLSSRGIAVQVGTIDSGYRGEWKATVTCHSRKGCTITPGMKLAQVVFERAIRPQLVPATVTEDTARGSAGFGSSDAVGGGR